MEHLRLAHKWNLEFRAKSGVIKQAVSNTDYWFQIPRVKLSWDPVLSVQGQCEYDEYDEYALRARILRASIRAGELIN